MRDYKKVNNENLINMDKVDKKYESQLMDIVLYLQAELNESDSAEAINDILAIIIEAQDRGEDISKVIGEDYIEFCADVVKSYKNENKLYGLKRESVILKIAIAMLPFFFALDIINGLPIKELNGIKGLNDLYYYFTINPIVQTIFMTAIAWAVLRFFAKRKMSKIGWKSFGIMYLFAVIAIGISIIVTNISKNVISIKGPNYSVMICVAVVLILGYIIVGIASLCNKVNLKNKV